MPRQRDSHDPTEFRDWFDEQLRARGMTISQLAKTASVSRGYLSLLRRGKRKPSYGVVVALTKAFGARGQLDRILPLVGLPEADEHSDLKMAREERRAMTTIVSSLSTPLTLEETVCRITDGIAAIIPFDYGNIALVDWEARRMTVIAHKTRDMDRAAPGNSEHSPATWSLTEGVTGWVATNARAARLGDVMNEKRFLRHWQFTRSELAVPMILDGRVAGVLNIESDAADHFTEHDEALLTLAASSITLAVDRVKIRSELGDLRNQFVALSELHRTLLEKGDESMFSDALAHAIVRLFPRFGMCVVRMFDPDFNILQLAGFATQGQVAPSVSQLGYKMPITDSITGSAVLGKRYVVAPDVQTHPHFRQRDLARDLGLHAMIAVPIPAVDMREAPLGSISVYTTTIGHIFKADDVRLLIDIARFVTVALAALRNSILLRSNIDLAEIVSHRAEARESVARVCEHLLTRLAAESCSISLLDGGRTIVEARANVGLSEADNFLFSCVSEWACRRGRSVRLCGQDVIVSDPDLRAHIRTAKLENQLAEPHGAFIVVPINQRDGVAGIIKALRRSDVRDFTRAEQELLEKTAKQLAIARDSGNWPHRV